MSNGNGSTAFPYPLTPAQYRALFPAFADSATYSDTTVQMWLDMGGCMVNCGWGCMQAFGQGLWAAHEMWKLGPNSLTAKGGNGLDGIVANKSVGPVSVGYDTSLTKVEGAGPYNDTIYGQQYYQLALAFGLGPYQFGPPEPAPPGAMPWYGPVPYLYWDW
jgi:hypothetical protein